MLFNLFTSNSNAYQRRASTLLHEARMARVEHQAAAEHHAALAEMYTERVRRLEGEVLSPVDWNVDVARKPHGPLASLHSLEEEKKRRDTLTSDAPR